MFAPILPRGASSVAPRGISIRGSGYVSGSWPVRHQPWRKAMTTVAAILKHKGYQVTTVSPTLSIERVTGVLAEQRIGEVLVLDSAGQLLGIVSERDIVRCQAANGARTLVMTAGQLMTRALQVAHPDTKVAEAMACMTVGRFRH